MKKHLWIIPLIIGLPATLFLLATCYMFVLFDTPIPIDRTLFAFLISLWTSIISLGVFNINRSRL